MTMTSKTVCETPARNPRGIVHPLQAARLLAASVAAILKTIARRRRVREMSELPDYILTDMGIRRDDISQALRSNWREDPTYRLAVAAGKRRRGLCD